jgi:ABC-2 type transport system permease protein
VTGWADVYRTLVRVSLASMLQYRASNAIWMIGSILEPVVYLVVWSTVARGEGGEVAGYAPRDLAAYYITLLFVNHLTFSWVMHEFQYLIQTGQFSFILLRPLHPIHGDLTDNIAYKLVMLAVMVPAAVVLWLAFQPRFETGAGMLLALPALVLSFALRFTVEWTLALGAFWTTRVTAVNQTYFAVMMFLSGRVAPVALLPDWLRFGAEALPFYWMVGFPVELVLGRVEVADALAGFAVQLLWIGAAGALLSVIWRRAARQHAAVGQ